MARSSSLLAAIAALPAWLPAAAAQQPPPVGAPTEAPIDTRLRVLARDARDWVDRRRLAAWEELLALGEPGRKVLLPIVRAKLERDRAALAAQYAGPELAHARKRLEEELAARRREALACIFDGRRYPDADHGAAGQPEVDRLVGRVRAAWERPASFARTTMPEVEALAAALEEDVVYLEAAGGNVPEELATVSAWLARFDAAFARERLGIPDSQREWNAAVARYHAEELLTSADDEELACMRATNAYREMMGLGLLEIDERLVRAARKHSVEMAELGYFDHSSPVPENRSPGARCAREGHPGGGAENIAAGMSRGEHAFDAWYRSSGHHRNILGGHQQIGVGRRDELWTQNFGGGSSLRGHRIEDPQIQYLARLRKLDPASAASEAALALWCRSQELDDLARLHAERALALDPNHPAALELLGRGKAGGR